MLLFSNFVRSLKKVSHFQKMPRRRGQLGWVGCAVIFAIGGARTRTLCALLPLGEYSINLPTTRRSVLLIRRFGLHLLSDMMWEADRAASAHRRLDPATTSSPVTSVGSGGPGTRRCRTRGRGGAACSSSSRRAVEARLERCDSGACVLGPQARAGPRWMGGEDRSVHGEVGRRCSTRSGSACRSSTASTPCNPCSPPPSTTA